MISLDCETTGMDLRHGAKPFLVTSCDDHGTVCFWESFVDPYTRNPHWSREDLKEITGLLSEHTLLVLQNPKFDALAVSTILPKLEWPWYRTVDTLLAGHLLASNQPHDLTSMALIYLGVNLKPLEDTMEECVKEARKLAKSDYPKWQIAAAGRPDMPSAKEKVWKYDMWLPRALAAEKAYQDDHPWWHCTANYANGDSTATIALYQAQLILLDGRGLWPIYKERLQLLPVVHAIEKSGMTLCRHRTEELIHRLETEAAKNKQVCLAAADGEIEDLPLNGTSNALKHVVFNKFGLKANKKTGTGNPSMDKSVLEYWLSTLPSNSKPHCFVRNLRSYRRRMTGVGYAHSYQKFWVPTDDPDVMMIYSSLNPTGTDTLRFSSQYPNQQQISKQEEVNLRYCFGPAPDREWWSLDAKNIELRLPAYESGEQDLIDLFEHPDDPPYYGSTHLLNFHTVYEDLWNNELNKVGIEQVGPHCKKKFASTWYQWCKNGGFAVQYGAVDTENGMGTADRAFNRPGAHALLKSRFGKLEKLNQKWIKFAEKYGYVETMPDRTVDPDRGYPLLCSRTNYGRIMPTVPLNYHIQGTAMWWMSRAMVKVHAHLTQMTHRLKREYKIVMQVHDELVLDFPAPPADWKKPAHEYNLPYIRKIQALMASIGDDLGVPTPVGCEYHSTSWDKGVSV